MDARDKLAKRERRRGIVTKRPCTRLLWWKGSKLCWNQGRPALSPTYTPCRRRPRTRSLRARARAAVQAMLMNDRHHSCSYHVYEPMCDEAMAGDAANGRRAC